MIKLPVAVVVLINYLQKKVNKKRMRSCVRARVYVRVHKHLQTKILQLFCTQV